MAQKLQKQVCQYAKAIGIKLHRYVFLDINFQLILNIINIIITTRFCSLSIFIFSFSIYRFNNLKPQRAEKRKGTETEPGTSKITRRSSGGASKVDFTKCFFCNNDSGDLHGVTMFKLNTRVKECALQLQDTILLAKLSARDMISQDTVYHKNCLVALYNRTKRSRHENTQENAERQYQGITLGKLVSYIEEIRAESTMSIPVFKLTELAKLYSDRLEELGAKIMGPIHTTQLKDRILANIPDMQAHKHDRNVLLAFNEDTGTVLNNAYGCDFDDEGMILSQAARIVRRSMPETIRLTKLRQHSL